MLSGILVRGKRVTRSHLVSTRKGSIGKATQKDKVCSDTLLIGKLVTLHRGKGYEVMHSV